MIVLVWYTAWMRQSSTWLSDLKIGHCHIAILSLGPGSGQVQTSGPIVCGSTPKAFKHLRESLHYHKFYKDRAEIGPAKLAKWAKLFRENAQNAQNWRGHYKKNLAGAWFPMFDHDQLNRVETSALEQLLFATGCLSRSHSACNQTSCLLLLHAFSGIRTPLLGAVRSKKSVTLSTFWSKTKVQHGTTRRGKVSVAQPFFKPLQSGPRSTLLWCMELFLFVSVVVKWTIRC